MSKTKEKTVPKSFSKAFYEKYRPMFAKARKDLGFELGGYAALLKIKKDDPKVFNRIIEDTEKEIKADKKENNKSKGGVIKSRTGPQDYRKGGMVLSNVDNRKNK
jgi:hypothetical protein